MTESVSALPIELTFYCRKKEPCRRSYGCVTPHLLGEPMCLYLVAKSDREVFDKGVVE